ncbi:MULTISPECIES: YhgN family NAAT transporter [Alteromonadaceae]|uniref:YhgN family NAAT transporter n=1 Tax=Alteromonadaceae TaxID=72275 RepID=UPI001C092C13|nr:MULTISPECIES: YhgN family NAAT transporter [Aliiglaciecola]MBU2878886.1 YhgN family NAAT transporter [Aliiglaciecola lipolytica]MDO6712967.1 YhgN family NAAT transporter [Aliiglaciecola sp. 2_MG-2023]MDO6754006.1 YhgN family NAAT transporter [Aliiglaciecola sp. 1_MG-2023]
MDIWSAAVMLFLIMDPLGNLPIFMSILKSIEPKRRRKVLARELVLSLLIMFIFLFSGQAVLDFLNVKQQAVSIAGGIILFLIAIRMIFPNKGSHDDDVTEQEPFIVPLAIPMIAGPSLLAALILLANQDPLRMFDWSLALFSAWAVSASILMFSGVFFKILGERGLIAIERLMGMILIMLSIQMFLDGVGNYFSLGVTN